MRGDDPPTCDIEVVGPNKDAGQLSPFLQPTPPASKEEVPPISSGRCVEQGRCPMGPGCVHSLAVDCVPDGRVCMSRPPGGGESAGSPAWRPRCQVGIVLLRYSSAPEKRPLFGAVVTLARVWVEAPDGCQVSRRSILGVSGKSRGRGLNREPRTLSVTVAANQGPGSMWRWQRSLT